MTSLVGLLVVVLMLAAAIGFVAGELRGPRHPHRRPLAGATAIAGILLAYVESEGTVAHAGDWDPELGIVLVVDLMAALVLLVAMATILVVQLFAIGQRHCVGRRPPTVRAAAAGADLRGGARLPHRRPVHALRRLRVDPRLQLCAADPPGRRGQIRWA